MSGTHTGLLEVDLGAIRHNVGLLREAAGSAAVMAVVKGDAYGHGLVPAARAALDGGATWLGVAQLGEALALRDAGVEAPVVSWLHRPGLDLSGGVEADVDLGIAAVWSLEAAADAARRLGRPARVHLKADTGLARNGAYGDDWAPLVERAAQLQAEGAVDVVGVMSHLVAADDPEHPANAEQVRLFHQRVSEAEAAGVTVQVRHLANSAGTLLHPHTHLDLVRPGLAVYGLSPAPLVDDERLRGLRPAMRALTRVAVTKRVPAGQGVSYNHTYVTARETTLVDVPLGYADGVPRAGSSCAPLLVAGHRTSVAGRVCMDQLVADVGDHPVQPGDEVVLFGDPERGEPSAQEWAEATSTISYEIVTRMSSRLPRRYVG